MPKSFPKITVSPEDHHKMVKSIKDNDICLFNELTEVVFLEKFFINQKKKKKLLTQISNKLKSRTGIKKQKLLTSIQKIKNEMEAHRLYTLEQVKIYFSRPIDTISEQNYFHLAAQYSPEFTQICLDRDFNIFACDNLLNTPLHLAIKKNNILCIRAIIDHIASHWKIYNTVETKAYLQNIYYWAIESKYTYASTYLLETFTGYLNYGIVFKNPEEIAEQKILNNNSSTSPLSNLFSDFYYNCDEFLDSNSRASGIFHSVSPGSSDTAMSPETSTTPIQKNLIPPRSKNIRSAMEKLHAEISGH